MQDQGLHLWLRLFNCDSVSGRQFILNSLPQGIKKMCLGPRWENTFLHKRIQLLSSRCRAVSTLAADFSFPLSICFEGKVPDYREDNTMCGWPLFLMTVFPYYLSGLFFKTHLPCCCLLYSRSPLKFCQCG